MTYRLEFAEDAERDIELICGLRADGGGGAQTGDPAEQAARAEALRSAGESLAAAPHRGVPQSEIARGLRRAAIGRAVFWFDIDEDRRAVRILAVFLGGRDRPRDILDRLT